MSRHTAISLRLRKISRLLDISFDDGKQFSMSCEYLRVYSPSAEVMGHGQGQGELQTGKENVNIFAIEPVGNYAVRLVFDDQHRTGIFSWDYLYELGEKQNAYWEQYLQRLANAGHVRTPRSRP